MPEDQEIANQKWIDDVVLDGTTTSVTSKVIRLNKRGSREFSIHTIFSEDIATAQDLVASALMEVSNDPRAEVGDGSTAKWIDATTLGVTIEAITAGEGSIMDVFSDFSVAYLRITYTRSAGEGDVRSYISGQD